jgi:GNAT superfamily N-acetyltransferase
MLTKRFYIREILDSSDVVLPAVRRLYESSLSVREQIPWEWISRAADGSRAWLPDKKRRHLTVVQSKGKEEKPLGFTFGTYIPRFGGYICYVAVDPMARGLGVATALYQNFYALMKEDAQMNGTTLPFVIWESHPPQSDDPEEWENWKARLRLFEKTGGYWIKGVKFLAPDYMNETNHPLELKLFIAPQEKPLTWFTPHRLQKIVRGLYRHVYHLDSRDSLVKQTLESMEQLELVPANHAI